MSKARKALATTTRLAATAAKAIPAAFATRGTSLDATGSNAPSGGAVSVAALSPRARSLFVAACAALLTVAVLAFSTTPPPALAGTVTNERPFLFAFDGHDASAGAFTAPNSIAIDNSTGAVYVANDSTGSYYEPIPGFVSRFNAEGQAQNFSATGTSSLLAPSAPIFQNLLGVAVDNSGRPGHQGDLLVSQYGEPRVRAFDSSGNFLWTLMVANQGEDVAVDASGHPWTVPAFTSGATEYANTGSPPAPTGCKIDSGGASAIDVDASGNVYIRKGYPVYGIVKYTKTGPCTYTQSVFDSAASNVYVDQSNPSGHIFTAQEGNFEEYDASGAHLGTYGSGYLSKGGDSIAYNPSKDWVYVVQRYEPHPVVAVFGSPTSGTTPAVTETTAAPTGSEISTAHLAGKVNPEGVGTETHFEWKKSNESWASAAARQSSPPRTLPATNTEEPVEFDTDELRGKTTYQVRLVGVNSTNHLAGFSASPVSITTKKASEPPAITVEPVNPVGTTTATANAQINPKGDTADWHLEIQRACSGSWTSKPTETIAHAASSPVAVHYDLSGLLSSERYCVRFVADNSYNPNPWEAVTSVSEEFETAAVPPAQVETAFAAPRADTTARLNGRANSEGEALIYRFEWSEDGGATWTVRPDQEDTSEARRPLVLSTELEHLSPATTYSYRFVAENPAGELTGSVKTFTTRPAETEPTCPNAVVRSKQHSEYLPDCRGIELVNNPEKGNQNIGQFSGGVSMLGLQLPDGEEATWSVVGGAPGSPTGTGSFFLAHRTSTGWQSTSLIPPADQQIGEGNWAYEPLAATPDLSRFLLRVHDPVQSKLVRLDPELHEEVLRSYPHKVPAWQGDLSTDGAQAVAVNEETNQLEKVGSGEPAEVLSVMPDGEESECGMAGAGTGESFMRHGPTYHALASTDGSRVYFETHPNGECSVYGRRALYERNLEAHTTTLIDPGPGPSGRSPEFIRATPDGRHAYFVTSDNCRSWSQTGPLSCEAPETNDHNSDADVYRWDKETGESSCLTCEAASDAHLSFDANGHAEVLVSDDFSHIYFASRERLAPGATPGAGNVYVLSGGSIRFVAAGGELRPPTESGSQISANGNVLVFETNTEEDLPADSLTTDEIGECGGSASQTCAEIYRYDDTEGSLECLSCHIGGKTMHRGGQPEGHIGRRVDFVMSADGSTVAFVTQEALLPEDVNGEVDVYEWHEGRLSLITDGVSQQTKTELLTMDEKGSNIDFITVQPGLTGFEADGLLNLYDARVDGGFPPPTPPVHCTEDSCQGGLQPAPAEEQPASTNESRGNVVPRPSTCPKGKVRRRGRCVKRHRPSHQRKHQRRATNAKQGRSK